mgnify:CR=1 FL=1
MSTTETKIEATEVKEVRITWWTPGGFYVMQAVIRDGKLADLPPISQGSVERDIDGCITFLKKIKENII